MPKVVGYPVENLRRSNKYLDMRSRAEALYNAGRMWRTANREEKWRRSERQYDGDHWRGNSGQDQITINMSFSTVNTIVPYVTGAEPDFMVEPYGGDATSDSARLITAWLNRMWRSSKVAGNAHLERAVHDYLTYGDGYLKQSYNIADMEIDDEMMEVAELWVDRINPWDLWIDPASDGIHNARWVAHRLFIPKHVVEQSDKYKFTKDLGSWSAMGAEDSGRDPEAMQVPTGEGKDDLIAVIEFYDRLANRLVVFAEGADMPLRVVEDIDCPIVQLGNYIIPHSPYHSGEMEQLWELQMELNRTRSQMITHRKRNVQKYIAQEQALGEDAKAALQSSTVNELIFVKGAVDPSTVIQPLQVAQLSSDAYNISDVITRDIYEISGVNEYLRGGTPAISRTATEATIIESASNVKSQHKLRQVETFVRSIGQMLLSMGQVLYPMTDSEEMALILTGREAQAVYAAEQQGLANNPAQPQPGLPPAPEEAVSSEQVVDVEMHMTSEVWKGTYEVFVKQYSTELRNPVLKEQKYREMFSTILQGAPIMQQLGIQVPNLQKIMELWFEAAGIDDVDALLQPSEGQQQMLAQMQQMQQMQQAQAAGQGAGPEAQSGAPAPQNIGAPATPPSSQNTGAFGPESVVQ